MPPPTLRFSPSLPAGSIMIVTSVLVRAVASFSSLVECLPFCEVTSTVSNESFPVHSSRLPPLTLILPTPLISTVAFVDGERAIS